jgi:hypothetical protein
MTNCGARGRHFDAGDSWELVIGHWSLVFEFAIGQFTIIPSARRTMRLP